MDKEANRKETARTFILPRDGIKPTPNDNGTILNLCPTIKNGNQKKYTNIWKPPEELTQNLAGKGLEIILCKSKSNNKSSIVVKFSLNITNIYESKIMSVSIHSGGKKIRWGQTFLNTV